MVNAVLYVHDGETGGKEHTKICHAIRMRDLLIHQNIHTSSGEEEVFPLLM